jgi:hypothetical protein
MKRFKQVKTRLLLFLISGILLLSIGFVSCGTGPQTKTTAPDRGAYAVDFSAAPSELGFIDLSKSIDSMAGLTGFTIEAWVKRNTSSDLSGGIFSRSTGSESEGSYDGISLYIASDTPSTPRFKMSSGGSVTSVTATTALTNGNWTHIAGVLHAAVHGSCTSPHLDIYINGNLENCANATSPAAFSYSERIGRSHSELDSNTIEANTKLNAIIDEVRFWKAARTQAQIQTWMNQEINETNWNQANPNNELIGYWKLNEGAGSTIVDSSGTGNGGTKNYCNTDCSSGGNSILWDAGWVAGKSF